MTQKLCGLNILSGKRAREKAISVWHDMAAEEKMIKVHLGEVKLS